MCFSIIKHVDHNFNADINDDSFFIIPCQRGFSLLDEEELPSQDFPRPCSADFVHLFDAVEHCKASIGWRHDTINWTSFSYPAHQRTQKLELKPVVLSKVPGHDLENSKDGSFENLPPRSSLVPSASHLSKETEVTNPISEGGSTELGLPGLAPSHLEEVAGSMQRCSQTMDSQSADLGNCWLRDYATLHAMPIILGHPSTSASSSLASPPLSSPFYSRLPFTPRTATLSTDKLCEAVSGSNSLVGESDKRGKGATSGRLSATAMQQCYWERPSRSYLSSKDTYMYPNAIAPTTPQRKKFMSRIEGFGPTKLSSKFRGWKWGGRSV